MRQILHVLLLVLLFDLSLRMSFATAESNVVFDTGNTHMDALVEECLQREGVAFLPGTDVICYNAAIFPRQYLKLNDLGPASRIIITSPGGNVATARLMSGILDRRSEPVTIAGPCVSACAMIILPALEDIHVHKTAHIAVHGIIMMVHSTWWGWTRQDESPPFTAKAAAAFGVDLKYIDYDAGRDHMENHLADQGVDIRFIQSISDEMLSEARLTRCRVDPKHYWGQLDAEHLNRWLGAKITSMEAFAQTFDAAGRDYFSKSATPIGAKTYVFNTDLEEAGC